MAPQPSTCRATPISTSSVDSIPLFDVPSPTSQVEDTLSSPPEANYPDFSPPDDHPLSSSPSSSSIGFHHIGSTDWQYRPSISPPPSRRPLLPDEQIRTLELEVVALEEKIETLEREVIVEREEEIEALQREVVELKDELAAVRHLVERLIAVVLALVPDLGYEALVCALENPWALRRRVLTAKREEEERHNDGG